MKRTFCPLHEMSAIVILLVATLPLVACQSSSSERPDDIHVTSSSPLYQTAARKLASSCNYPAEFGRCGCYLDGLQTSCDVVARCLENGFCKVAASASQASSVESSSERFSQAGRALMEPCRIGAEFGRCGCQMDGFQTSCDIVNRCLEAGFCKLVRE